LKNAWVGKTMLGIEIVALIKLMIAVYELNRNCKSAKEKLKLKTNLSVVYIYIISQNGYETNMWLNNSYKVVKQYENNRRQQLKSLGSTLYF
jgi:hypothetical protein